jgi:hypothetical protein
MNIPCLSTVKPLKPQFDFRPKVIRQIPEWFFLKLGANETGYEMLVDLRSNGPVRPLSAWQGTKSLTNPRTTNILYPMLN